MQRYKLIQIDTSIVPGGCIKYVQAPDVSWNKLLKALATKKYEKWLAEEGINQETLNGNLNHRSVVLLSIGSSKHGRK